MRVPNCSWLILVFAFGCLAWEGQAAEVTLDSVMGCVGQTVTIEDEVEGESSNSQSGTLMLMFGAAYPRQKLIVRIQKEHESIQKRARGLLGLKVRVTGTVEMSRDGPHIRITTPDQFELIRDDTIDLIALGSGRPGFPVRTPPGPHDGMPRDGNFSMLVSWRLEALLRERRYEELERVAAAWRKPEARMLDGRWYLFIYYNVLGADSRASEDGFAESRRALEDWRRERPRALEPVILLAELETAHAWHARGSGWGSTVSEDGWRLFRERLEKARLLLESVAERRLECPEWTAAMQTVALGQGWPHDRVRKILKEGTRAWPEYWTYYFNESLRLLPRWQGEPREWEAYSRSFPGDLGRELSARIPWARKSNFKNVFREADIPWSQMRDGFEFLVKRYPQSIRTKSAYALYAGMAEDRETCKRLLDEVGDEVDMSFWYDWRSVDAARNWIADPNRPPPAIFGLSKPRASEPPQRPLPAARPEAR